MGTRPLTADAEETAGSGCSCAEEDGSGVGSGVGSGAESDVGSDVGFGVDSDVDPDVETDVDSDVDSGVGSDLETDVDSDVETGAVAVCEHVGNVVAVAEAEVVPEAEAEGAVLRTEPLPQDLEHSTVVQGGRGTAGHLRDGREAGAGSLPAGILRVAAVVVAGSNVAAVADSSHGGWWRHWTAALEGHRTPWTDPGHSRR